MKYSTIIKNIIIFILFLNLTSFARPFRVNQIPNGYINSCANCHVNPDGGGERNVFGKLIESTFLSVPGSTGQVLWGPELAGLDADEDGVTNGVELQDPMGEWITGQPSPGNSSLVTLPGDPSSFPLITFINQEITGFTTDYELKQNYPNPFNPTTKIDFSLKESGFVTLKVYNILGKELTTLVNENLPTGKFYVNWNAQNFESGIYFYMLQTNNYTDTKKMLLIK